MKYRKLGYTLTIFGAIFFLIGFAALFGLAINVSGVILCLAAIAIGGFLVVFGAVNVSNSRKLGVVHTESNESA